MGFLKIFIAIIVFSILVIFHEFGHFIVAKANKIQVNEFSLGLGPTLFGFHIGETKYSLKLLPFGGACMMEGEDGESDNPRAFPNKPVWARILVVAAGPIFNFIMAFLFSFVILMCIGYDKPVIENVMDGYPAQEAGLQAGDTIVKLNHHRIFMFREISAYNTFHSGETIDVTYRRDHKLYKTTMTPKYDEETQLYYLGVQGSKEYERGNVLKCLEYSVFVVRYWIDITLNSLKYLLTGHFNLNDLAGPVGIVKNMGDVYEESVTTSGYFYGFLNMLNWAVILSANLGVMNLLPLPALDGGRLFFMLIELITRKKIPVEKEGMVHFVGIVLLMGLMVVIMFNDIRKLFM